MELVLRAPGLSIEQPKPRVTSFTHHILRIENSHSADRNQYLDDTLLSGVTVSEALSWIERSDSTVDAVLVNRDITENGLRSLREAARQKAVPFILFTQSFDATAKEKAFSIGADDYHYGALSNGFFKRLEFIRKVKSYKNLRGNRPYVAQSVDLVPQIKLWSLKRAFDILVSATALLLLSPLCILIALIIKLESRGPVFYVAKRAGTGYKIFNFYKFRSMRAGSDAELTNLAHLNQYNGKQNGHASNSVFVKIKNDPRITRFGAFIRKTSLDEIPQLLNVLLGDMSLVGNRPLPLYEAEKLTKDQIAWRFLAPAGITGLWQITKRGKDNMSEDERIALDMEYAMKNSFWLDLKILFSTIPAVIQKEKV